MARLIAVLTLIIAIVPFNAAWSQTSGTPPPSNLPAAAPALPVAPPNPPAEEAVPAPAPGAAEAPPAPAPEAPVVVKKPRVTHHHAPAKVEFEPASGRLKLKQDTYVFASPSRLDKKLEKAQAAKFVNVTGVTHYYVRVRLKDGRIGYVPNSAVEMVKPFDKEFLLSSNSPVYAEPNRWAKKVSAVHKGHNVHVIGLAPSYIKIRMKSGLEGYVPQSAVE